MVPLPSGSIQGGDPGRRGGGAPSWEVREGGAWGYPLLGEGSSPL